MKMNARYAAFLAVNHFVQKGIFLEETLASVRDLLESTDFRLAQEIAYGTTRMSLALSHIAKRINGDQTLSLKRNERALLQTALYQAIFMDRIPLYAIVNDTVSLAKKLFHSSKASFFNALLRKVVDGIPLLPHGLFPEQLSIRYSLPEAYVRNTIDAYGLDTAISIFKASNLAGTVSYRKRLNPVSSDHVFTLSGTSDFGIISSSPEFYIQNKTPVEIIEYLAKETPTPCTILDLCAAPGGKLLAAHDLFPAASLYANDSSKERLALVEQNAKKYGMQVTLSCYPGEHYPTERKFDLIIVDAPCSNTGVFNKRPEARWRYEGQALLQLEELQTRLMLHAIDLLAPGGVIWYITCSIMPQENENVVNKICNQTKTLCSHSIRFLPDNNGRDGGYGALIKI